MLSFPFAFTLVSCPTFQLVAVKPSTLLQEDPRSLEQPALDRRTSLAKLWTVWIRASINLGIGLIVSDATGIVLSST